MSKLLIALAVLLVVGIGAFFVLSGNDSGVTGNVILEKDSNNVKTFILTGENFKFTMSGVDKPEIRVKEGDRVRIEFSSVGGFHDWKIDEFDAATEQVRDTDGMTFVEFIADEKGTFEYYCSVGQHRANGMWGNFIVENF